MIFDIKNEKSENIPNFKGGEKFFTALHDTNSEIIYFLSGKGTVLYDGEKLAVEAGQCHYCPKGHSHSLINDSDEDLVFFAVVPNQ